jgi:hypothetical protein
MVRIQLLMYISSKMKLTHRNHRINSMGIDMNDKNISKLMGRVWQGAVGTRGRGGVSLDQSG